ncbi:MAG: YtxH domain-containing protein [Paludibacter sp.]
MKNSAGIIAAFLGGALIGAALGVLFAPESGEETRKKLLAELEKNGIKFPTSENSELSSEDSKENASEVK